MPRDGSGFLARIEQCKEILAREPGNPGVLSYLGRLYLACGRSRDAVGVLLRAANTDPGDPAVHSGLLHALLLCPGVPIEELGKAHAAFGRKFDRPRGGWRPCGTPRRRLRIGYVSDSFRDHSISFFFEPLLRHHDRRGFRITCFSNSPQADSVTRRLRRLAGDWFDISAMDDDRAEALVRGQQIDILVELGGHIGDNRLGLLGRKVAPVQCSTWDYPFSSGMRTIDYHLTDSTLCPPGSESQFTERLIRLPRAAMCYRPPSYAPRVSPLPAARNGFLTFAAFHLMAKMTPESIEMWAGVLSALPGSRLILHHLFEGRRHVAKLLRRDIEMTFERLGIPARRIRWVGAAGHTESLRLYQQADLALDSCPYSGCTTTAESLWMGVPVITCPGARISSRHSATMLRAAGLDRFIAGSPRECAKIAMDCAADLRGLAVLRRGMRKRMAESALTDGRRYAWEVERAYLRMWKEWSRCAVAAG